MAHERFRRTDLQISSLKSILGEMVRPREGGFVLWGGLNLLRKSGECPVKNRKICVVWDVLVLGPVPFESDYSRQNNEF